MEELQKAILLRGLWIFSKKTGLTSGLVNLGGNVQALGTKTDGSNWRVAVQSPDDTEDYLGVLSIRDKAVITSGGYERYFEQDGVTYHHIIDPKTGYPAENGLVSVTIVSSDGTLADGLSTSLFIMGERKSGGVLERRTVRSLRRSLRQMMGRFM